MVKRRSPVSAKDTLVAIERHEKQLFKLKQVLLDGTAPFDYEMAMLEQTKIIKILKDYVNRVHPATMTIE